MALGTTSRVLGIATLAAVAAAAWGQPAWRPEKPVEFVIRVEMKVKNSVTLQPSRARDWGVQFMKSRELAKYLEAEQAAARTMMTELGLAK